MEYDLSNLNTVTVDNWDGFGAAGLSSIVIANANVFASKLQTKLNSPDIVPLPNGTVAFEWEVDSRSVYLEIGETRFVMLAKIHDGSCIASGGNIVDFNFEHVTTIASYLNTTSNSFSRD